MEYLYLGVAIFFGIHLVSVTPLKKLLISKLTVNGYKGCYSVLSFVGLGLMIYGKSNTINLDLFSGYNEFRNISFVLMWLSFVMLMASLLKTNIKRLTRHPMLWAVVLWSGSHLLVNSDQASVVLFGSFLVYSLFAMASQTWRGAKLSKTKVAIYNDVVVLLAGSAVFVAFVWYLHALLFGVGLR